MQIKQTFLFHIARLKVLHRGVWFVDIPRTSSSSIRSEMSKAFGSPYGKANLMEKEYASSQSFSDHQTASEMRNLLGSYIWDRIFTFSVVRNPWDRTYSLFNYRRRIGNIAEHVSFKEYVVALGSENKSNPMFRYHGFRLGAADYLVDERGEIMVDFVAKFENRTEDLKFISSKIGSKGIGSLHLQSASPPGVHYTTAYDEETRAIIERLYAKDVELFAYAFGE